MGPGTKCWNRGLTLKGDDGVGLIVFDSFFIEIPGVCYFRYCQFFEIGNILGVSSIFPGLDSVCDLIAPTHSSNVYLQAPSMIQCSLSRFSSFHLNTESPSRRLPT